MKYRSPLLAVVLSLLVAGAVNAQAMTLLSKLGDLGVSPTQALGGAQALMNVAKGNLGADEFSQLLGGAPELGQLMEMTEAVGGDAVSGMMGGASSSEGESGSSAMGGMAAAAGAATGMNLDALMNNADLVQQFTDLGLGTDMIGQFVPPLLEVAGMGSSGTAGLLQKGLGIL